MIVELKQKKNNTNSKTISYKEDFLSQKSSYSFYTICMSRMSRDSPSLTCSSAGPREDLAEGMLKWLYYSSSMGITYAACHLYQHDMALWHSKQAHHSHPAPSAPFYPGLLLVLNLATIGLIWAHFVSRRRCLLWTTSALIALLSLYRKLVTATFNVPLNLPLFGAAVCALGWLLLDGFYSERQWEAQVEKVHDKRRTRSKGRLRRRTPTSTDKTTSRTDDGRGSVSIEMAQDDVKRDTSSSSL